MTNSLINVIVTSISLGCAYLLFKNRNKKIKGGEENGACSYQKKALPEQESEKDLYVAVLEQLRDFYHIQFSTGLSSIVRCKTPAQLPNVQVNILVADPVELTPKLAVLLTAGGRIWYDNENHEAIKILQAAGISVLTLPKQDFYNKGEGLVSEMLDALNG